jgi:hypothetical protein
VVVTSASIDQRDQSLGDVPRCSAKTQAMPKSRACLSSARWQARIRRRLRRRGVLDNAGQKGSSGCRGSSGPAFRVVSAARNSASPRPLAGAGDGVLCSTDRKSICGMDYLL